MKKLSKKEIVSKLKAYPAWIYDDEGQKLASSFEFEDFRQAMEFANGIASIANDLNHHPDILVHDYKFVTVFTGTHDIKGISDKDFKLVARIEDDLVEVED